jgi:hypothetical protein
MCNKDEDVHRIGRTDSGSEARSCVLLHVFSSPMLNLITVFVRILVP